MIYSPRAFNYSGNLHAACRQREIPPSRFQDVVEARDGNDVREAKEDSGGIGADAEPNGVVEIGLAGGGAVGEVVQVGTHEFQELAIEADEAAEADVSRAQINDDDLANQLGESFRAV